MILHKSKPFQSATKNPAKQVNNVEILKSEVFGNKTRTQICRFSLSDDHTLCVQWSSNGELCDHTVLALVIGCSKGFGQMLTRIAQNHCSRSSVLCVYDVDSVLVLQAHCTVHSTQSSYYTELSQQSCIIINWRVVANIFQCTALFVPHQRRLYKIAHCAMQSPY